MSTDDPRTALVRLRQALTEELAGVSASLADVRAVRTGGNDDDEHDPDGSPLSGEWSRLESNRRATEAGLAAIDRALADIGAGCYGICTDCRRPIAAGRLEARPAARTCVACSDRAR